MKSTVYTCNICHTELVTEKYLVGIVLHPSAFVLEDAPHKCENHICITCLVALYPISKKYKDREEED